MARLSATTEVCAMKITKILFPTDFSEGALHAFPYAVDLAKNYGAKLYLIHVLYDIAVASGLHIPHSSMNTLYQELHENAKKTLESFAYEVRKGVTDIEFAVLRGVPYEETLKFADATGIDLIVIGTHGRKGLDRMLFGSTAERVVRNAACPVLTVRKPN